MTNMIESQSQSSATTILTNSDTPASPQESTAAAASSTFRLEDYEVGRGVQKSIKTTSHHSLCGMRYFNVPLEREEALFSRLFFLSRSPAGCSRLCKDPLLTLCEHPVADNKNRFYLDIDAKNSNVFRLKPFMKRVQREVISKLNAYERLVPKEELAKVQISPITWDLKMAVILQSGALDSYHIIWPFMLVTYEEQTELASKIAIIEGEQGVVDCPMTMRAPFCDKYDRDRGEMTGRPFHFCQVAGVNGRFMLDDDPAFPFMKEDRRDREPLLFWHQVWCLSSIRWHHYAIKGATEEDLPFDLQSPSSNTEWLKMHCSYDAKVLKNILEARGCETVEQVVPIVVKYVNCCGAVNIDTQPVTFMFKLKSPKNEPPIVRYYKRNDLKSLLGAPLITAKFFDEKPNGKTVTKNKSLSVDKVWVENAERRTITRAVFKPEEKVPDYELNLWMGLRFTKDECLYFANYHLQNGFCLRNVLLHIYNVWSPDCYAYIIKWMAHLVQKPNKKLSSALILCGPEGCGKDIVAVAFGTIFGKHFLRTANPIDIVGRFTSQLEDKVLVLVDELDKIDTNGTAALKALVSDDTTRVERKGIEVQMKEQNYLNFIFTSNRPNRQAIMEVGPQARRWVFVECNNFMENTTREYFNSFVEFLGIENKSYSGVKCFQNFLSKVDISNFEPRDIPFTQLLQEHKLSNMLNEHMFIWECISQGYILFDYQQERAARNNNAAQARPAGYVCGVDSQSWPTEGLMEINDQVLFTSYISWCGQRREKPVNKEKFKSSLRLLFGKEFHCVPGERPFETFFILPSIPQCEIIFDKYYVNVKSSRPTPFYEWKEVSDDVLLLSNSI